MVRYSMLHASRRGEKGREKEKGLSFKGEHIHTHINIVNFKFPRDGRIN